MRQLDSGRPGSDTANCEGSLNDELVGWRMFHVKPLPDDNPLSPYSVQQALAAVQVIATTAQAMLLSKHARLVLDANERMNLTRIIDPEAVLRLHVVDSLAFLPRISQTGGRIVDIGSGAGFPGIPLAVMGFDVVLCESVKKKAAFLADCVDQLGLSCAVEDMRAEELAAKAPGVADLVIARAVTGLASLVELAAPLLREGGRLIALKGSPEEAEKACGRIAAAMCGMVPMTETQYMLPGGERRTVFEFERRGTPRIRLPRRPGMAQKSPLVE